MTRLGWEQAVNFTASLFFQSFEISDSCVRAALLSFGTDAYLYSLLTQGTNQPELTNSLNVMRQEFRNQWTNTGAAIKLMSDVIFTSANGDREGVQNVAVIITDGPSNRNPETTIPNAQVGVSRCSHLFCGSPKSYSLLAGGESTGSEILDDRYWRCNRSNGAGVHHRKRSSKR